jgi:hypothetical protein
MLNTLSERQHWITQRPVKADATFRRGRAKLTLFPPVSLVVFSRMINWQAVNLEFDWHSGHSQSQVGLDGKPSSESSVTALLPKDSAA